MYKISQDRSNAELKPEDETVKRQLQPHWVLDTDFALRTQPRLNLMPLSFILFPTILPHMELAILALCSTHTHTHARMQYISERVNFAYINGSAL